MEESDSVDSDHVKHLPSRLKEHLSAVQTKLRGYVMIVYRKIKLRTVFYALLYVFLIVLVYLSLKVHSLTTHEKLIQAPHRKEHVQSIVPTLSRRDHTGGGSRKQDSMQRSAGIMISNHSTPNIHHLNNSYLRLFPWRSFTPSDTFSLIVLTFNRSDILFRLLNHYCSMAHLERVVVVWNNVDQTPPIERWEELGPHPVPVRFIVQRKNKLRNRLQPFPEIQTAAVLLMDDDILVSAQDVQFAFRVWKQFPRLIVGFFPRKHVRSAYGVYSYGSDELESQTELGSYAYSMVLTGAAFVHLNYLKMFNSTSATPKAVHELIDELHNCEDLAVNVMVGDYLAKVERPQCSGLFVKPTKVINLEKETETGYRGMWHDPIHLAERSHCLNQLASIYNGTLPLQYSDVAAISFQKT